MALCPECEGYGKVIGIDEDLVIRIKNLSVLKTFSCLLEREIYERMEKRFH